jgi:hypothetical protein
LEETDWGGGGIRERTSERLTSERLKGKYGKDGTGTHNKSRANIKERERVVGEQRGEGDKKTQTDKKDKDFISSVHYRFSKIPLFPLLLFPSLPTFLRLLPCLLKLSHWCISFVEVISRYLLTLPLVSGGDIKRTGATRVAPLPVKYTHTHRKKRDLSFKRTTLRPLP